MRTETEAIARGPQDWSIPIELDRLPSQQAFIEDWEHRFQAYGGGLGNGKTTAGCVKALLLSLVYPGNRGWIGRWDGKELRQTTMSEFYNILPEAWIHKRNDQQGYLKLKHQYGGSEVFYGDFKDARSLRSLNLGWFWVDQAEEIDKERWEHAVSRLRMKLPVCDEGGKPTGAYARTFGMATFNPEGTDSFLWRLFHQDSPYKLPDYHLYMASTFDGLSAGFVSQEYVDGMLAIFPEQARKRYLEGSWDVFEGRVFPAFDPAVHVIDPPAVSPEWKVYESIDHGIQNPTAVQWWAVDTAGNRILVDEHYEGGLKPVSYHAQIIKAKRKNFVQPVDITYLDSSCWAMTSSRGDTVYSVCDEYQEHGIFPVPGQKDWGTAFNRITQGLRSEPNHCHPITGKPGAPHIYISSHCTAFIREALAYRWKKARVGINQRNAPDEPVDYNDHHMDAWAYFEASHPVVPVVPEPNKPSALEVVRKRIAAYNPLADGFRDSAGTSGSWMSW